MAQLSFDIMKLILQKINLLKKTIWFLRLFFFRLRIGQSENDLLKQDSKEYKSSNPILKDSRYRSESVLSSIGRINRKSTIRSDIDDTRSKSSNNLKSNGLKSSTNSLQTEFQEKNELYNSDTQKESKE
ncbi:unnamed protein product [Schistosoma margrebowiei]|uniref:Uncharacterized protein n=1 Tax=Schistosoma margrebowiei TaxID=48269 RepID=A0A183LP51_9TREM|nr:unnamed protein product [Schistosoma margrebowiei]